MAQNIVPNLWFDGNAQEAVNFYVSVFPDGKIIGTEYYSATVKRGLAGFQRDFAGKVLTIEFEILGMRFVAINAGSDFKFSEAISFQVNCKNQEEIDYYRGKLSKVPKAEQCGWCKDQFGLSWQIVPENIAELMSRPGAYKTLMGQGRIVIEDYLEA